jgi:hypothetical protein
MFRLLLGTADLVKVQSVLNATAFSLQRALYAEYLQRI